MRRISRSILVPRTSKRRLATQARTNRIVYPEQISRLIMYPLGWGLSYTRFSPLSMPSIPLEADQMATTADTDTIVAGDLAYRSSTMPMTRESSMSGMTDTRSPKRSDLLTAGMR